MATKKPNPTGTTSNVGAHIENVHIDSRVDNSTNEHTRAAVVSLAEAAAENAKAITEIARALRGAPVTQGTGIHVSNVKGS